MTLSFLATYYSYCLACAMKIHNTQGFNNCKSRPSLSLNSKIHVSTYRLFYTYTNTNKTVRLSSLRAIVQPEVIPTGSVSLALLLLYLSLYLSLVRDLLSFVRRRLCLSAICNGQSSFYFFQSALPLAVVVLLSYPQERGVHNLHWPWRSRCLRRQG